MGSIYDAFKELRNKNQLPADLQKTIDCRSQEIETNQKEKDLRVGRRAILKTKRSCTKDDCLFCNKPSVLEAISGLVYIRCCESDKCKENAKLLAMSYARQIKAH